MYLKKNVISLFALNATLKIKAARYIAGAEQL